MRTIRNGDTVVTVSRMGSTVASWRHQGVDVFFPYQSVKIAQEIRIRGGMPIPFPLLGRTDDERCSGLPQHGFLRHTVLKLASHSGNRVTYVEPETVGFRNNFPWPYSLAVVTKALETGFSSSLTVRHTGNGDFSNMPLAFALHPYFRVDRSQAVVLHNRLAYTHNQYTGKGLFVPLSPEHGVYVILPGVGIVTMTLSGAYTGFGAGMYLWTDDPHRYFCCEPTVAIPGSFGKEHGVYVKPGESLTAACTFHFQPE